jgi:small subunit ribosomal protein S15
MNSGAVGLWRRQTWALSALSRAATGLCPALRPLATEATATNGSGVGSGGNGQTAATGRPEDVSAERTSVTAPPQSFPVAAELVGIPRNVYDSLPEPVQTALLAEFATGEQLQTWRERVAVRAFQRHELDTGSPEVQIAILTTRIANLTRHLRLHRKDVRTKRSLEHIVAQRRRLLRYLFRTEPERYEDTVERLGIRSGSLVDPQTERRARRPGDLSVPTGNRNRP